MSTRFLARVGQLTTIAVATRNEPSGGGQGQATYDSPVEGEGYVVERDEVLRQVDGEDVMSNLTVLWNAGQAVTPGRGDRLTVPAGSTDDFIVLVSNPQKRLLSEAGALDHTILKCREE